MRWFGMSMNPPAATAVASRDAVNTSIERDVVRLQPFRIDVHLNLAVALAPDSHVRHAADRHQPRPNRPFGQRRQLDLRQLVRGKADLHDAAQ